MSIQLKILLMDKSKVKSSERMQQAVDELEYLVTFGQSVNLPSHGQDNAELVGRCVH